MLIFLCKNVGCLDATDTLRDHLYVAVFNNNSRGKQKNRHCTITFHSVFYWHKVRNVVATHIDLVDFSKINCITCLQHTTEFFSLLFLFFSEHHLALPHILSSVGWTLQLVQRWELTLFQTETVTQIFPGALSRILLSWFPVLRRDGLWVFLVLWIINREEKRRERLYSLIKFSPAQTESENSAWNPPVS